MRHLSKQMLRAARLIILVVVAGSGPAASARSFPVAAGTVVGVVIAGADASELHLRLATGAQTRVLTIAGLPRTSRSGITVGARRFLSAVLAPARTHVAFSTQGRVHGWVAILDLGTGRVRELLLMFEGHGDELVWSRDGRYIALTDHGPSGLSEVGVYVAATGKPVERLLSVLTARFFEKEIETFGPGWAAGRLRFKARPAGSSRVSVVWEIGLDGTGLKRIEPSGL